jgi:hypothetical protein
MSLPLLLEILSEYVPVDEMGKDLFEYYAKRALQRAKQSDADRAIVSLGVV